LKDEEEKEQKSVEEEKR